VRRHWVYVLLACWGAMWFAILAPRGGIDWKFFTTGTSLLFGGHPTVITGITGGPSTAGPAGLPGPPPPGGLHIFANYPALQMGPFSYLVTAVLRHLSPDNGLVATEVLLALAGLLIVYLIDRIAQPLTAALTLLVGGAAFMVAWIELAAAFAHLDDGLALLLAVLAVYAARSGHPVLTGLCTGLAADAKPWALVFLPILLITCTDTTKLRQTLTATITTALTIAAAWLPFFIADPNTIAATRFLIRNEPDSALRALGVRDNYTPRWDRLAQALLGCVLGALAIARKRWPAVLLLAGGARIVLDPAAHSYYTPDVMAGALLWDVLVVRRPCWTIISFAALNLAPILVKDPAAQGAIRLALVAAFTFATLVLPVPDENKDKN
jgi:hypothetical protein